jgi:hypothetical protein
MHRLFIEHTCQEFHNLYIILLQASIRLNSFNAAEMRVATFQVLASVQ